MSIAMTRTMIREERHKKQGMVSDSSDMGESSPANYSRLAQTKMEHRGTRIEQNSKTALSQDRKARKFQWVPAENIGKVSGGLDLDEIRSHKRLIIQRPRDTREILV